MVARTAHGWLWGCGLLFLFAAGAAAQEQPGVSPHGKLALPCATCHSADGWRPARISRDFSHARYGFALEAGHSAVSCTSCHQVLDFSKVQNSCAGCHRDVHRAELGTDCAQCHNTRAFGDRSVLQQLHALSRFPLEGAHRAVDCVSCHTTRTGVSLAFRGAPTSCIGCHRPDFQKTSSPNHPAAGFSTDCTGCHTNVSWRTAGFNHNTTQFPLTGGHQAATCQACHADGVYKGKPTACVSCHQANFTATTNPPHQPAGFPTTCTICHNTTAWAGAVFDHNTTQFPLTGGHQAATCQACHGDGVYVGKPTTCVSCHQSNFTATTNPAHQAAGFPTTCATCHTTATWTGVAYAHTQFPLTGAHQAASCQQCHGDGVYRGKPATCVSCHQSAFNGTTNPPHQAAGFPTTCTACHTTTTWTGAVFNHSTTQFPLTGAHQAATCQACHSDGVYDGKPTTCISCHQAKYSATTNPPHQAAGYSTDCTTCHTTTTWTGAVFNHSTTQFPLTGAHQAATCQQCHGDGVYDGKPTTCISCHQASYGSTSNPPHQAAGFPTSCTDCHTTTTWTGAVFDHNATQFPLTGAHLAATCQQCHSDGVYNGKPTTCVSCHQTDYSATTNPAHQAAGFPTTCGGCHTTTTWAGAVFDHSTTQFPLTGAHVAATCQQCHSDGVYDGKLTTCVSCHQADYNTTTNPAHLAAGFPTTCATCHTTITWTGATFDHDGPYFPIYSGSHQGRWTSCSQCHQNPAAYAQFTCLTCHEHDQTSMDSKHQGRSGYSYTSIACYTCHPRGTH